MGHANAEKNIRNGLHGITRGDPRNIYIYIYVVVVVVTDLCVSVAALWSDRLVLTQLLLPFRQQRFAFVSKLLSIFEAVTPRVCPIRYLHLASRSADARCYIRCHWSSDMSGSPNRGVEYGGLENGVFGRKLG